LLYCFITSGNQLDTAGMSKLFCRLCCLSAFNFWTDLQADSSAWTTAEDTALPFCAHPEHLYQTGQHSQRDSRCFVLTIRTVAFAADAHSKGFEIESKAP